VITYASLISVSKRAGRWQLALELFDRMQRERVFPNTVTFNSIMNACAQGTALPALQNSPPPLPSPIPPSTLCLTRSSY